MTMFTRGDKPSDQIHGATVPAQKTESPMSIPSDGKRAQAYTQPIASAQAPGVSLISKALKITGQLESTEDIQIEGEVEGDVRAVTVSVGSNARVKGTVHGDRVELAGTVEGKIEAKTVVLKNTAHMSGDVVHQDITIESGAFIDGHLKPEFGKSAVKAVQPPQRPAAATREPSPPTAIAAAPKD